MDLNTAFDFRSVPVLPGGLADDGLVAEEALQNVAGQGAWPTTWPINFICFFVDGIWL